jgi:DNA-binding transcriptional LysR family regulator
VFARARHPARLAGAATLADLLDAPWILPAASAPVRSMIESVFYRRGLPLPRDRMEISALGIARTLLLESDALMFLPVGTFRREEETEALVQLALGIDEVVEEVGLFWREGAQRRALELYFVRLLEMTCSQMGLAPSDMQIRHISK